MNYIFDLDFTLYSNYDINKSTDTKFYKSFKEKQFLNKLLNQLKLKNRLYIFSNGNKNHVDYVIKKMKMKTLFEDTANRDEYSKFPKPDIRAYKYVIKKFKLDKNIETFFFEDTIENLETAKKIGWVTVFINNDKIPKKKLEGYKFIDYKFSCVEQALIFLIYKFDN